jgi:hypothetical protein
MYLAFLTFGGTTAFIPTFNAIIADTSTMQQRATFFAALSIAGNVASGLSSAVSIIVQRLDLPWPAGSHRAARPPERIAHLAKPVEPDRQPFARLERAQ